MDGLDRPAIRALVAYWSPAFGLIKAPLLCSLEDAVQYHALGFAVLVDPADEAAFRDWQEQQRYPHLPWRRA